MAGQWFRLRQILFLLLFCTAVLLLWKAYDTSALLAPELYETSRSSGNRLDSLVGPPDKVDTQLTERPLSFDVEVKGRDDGKRENSKTEERQQPKQALLSQTCRIPKLDINGSEIIKFFAKPAPLSCNDPGNWAFIDENAKSKASCDGIAFTRESDEKLAKHPRVELVVGQALPSDYVIVNCSEKKETWKGLLMSVVPSQELIDKKKKVIRGADWSGMNVYFLGFDSLSQQSFRRSLPKTVRFLEEELKSVVLNGYNIVGDGTPQAFIPILTGSTEEELPLTRKRFKQAHFVDDVYPFVWSNFSAAGYATLYGEDAAAIGTFTYRLKGFRKQPTDHYTRTFFQEAERTLSNMKCLGSEPFHKSWFRYAEEFMTGYSDIPRFLLMHHSMLSHDDINMAGVLDDDLEGHLKKMKDDELLEDSIVIVMADHGHRFAKLRETHQGQLEERLPFFSVSLPESLREGSGAKGMINLAENAERLTSPFDIHQTLLDVLHWPKEESLVQMQDATKQRSLSLFRPIPQSRTCADAGIEPHWCTCLDWQDALNTEEDTQKSAEIAQAIVDTINEQTEKDRSHCAPLKLKQLHYAKKLVPNSGLLAYKAVKDADGFVPDLTGTTKPAFAHYQLKISTSPGRAIYEVTVLYKYKEKRLVIDLASLSHVNPFGDDPHCIIDKNYFLATFCVCYDRI